MEQYKQTFTQTSFQEELAGYFPLLHRIMSEANKVDLEDFVKEEETDAVEEADNDVKESAFDQFESWAEAVEQGKLTDDEIQALKQALADQPELELTTAYNFFNEFGIDDSDLEDKFRQAAELDSSSDPMGVFQLWAQENYPELLVALGMSGTQAPAQPAPEAPPAEENTDMVPPPGAMEEGFDPAAQDYSDWLDITRKETMRSGETDGANSLEIMANNGDDITDVIRNILAYVKQNSQELGREVSDETGKTVKDAIIDIKNNFPQQYQAATQPQGVAEGEEGKGSMVQEVAKIVKSFYNRDNPEVGPFRGEEGIVIDVEKQISEKFGEQAGQQAGKMAEAFMAKLTQEWQQKHGQVASGHGDDGLARLKELLGNVKAKVEGIGDQGQGGRDFNKNIMPAEEEASHQTQTTMKHADNPTYQQRMAGHDIKPGIAGYRDRIAMLKDLERTGKLKKEDLTAFEDIMKLAGLAK